ncbi:hypothetical protein [Nocardia sp. NPDC052566]|uniref:hypothetical protein n=1 Tax=Nocardia sp. NPDC052566 TaxID=3364330 RepID=UPI0037CB827A
MHGLQAEFDSLSKEFLLQERELERANDRGDSKLARKIIAAQDFRASRLHELAERMKRAGLRVPPAYR